MIHLLQFWSVSWPIDRIGLVLYVYHRRTRRLKKTAQYIADYHELNPTIAQTWSDPKRLEWFGSGLEGGKPTSTTWRE